MGRILKQIPNLRHRSLSVNAIGDIRISVSVFVLAREAARNETQFRFR